MRGKDNMRTGGQVLVDQLAVHGVRHVFCVPGESYLAALDAFQPRPERPILRRLLRGGDEEGVLRDVVGDRVIAYERAREPAYPGHLGHELLAGRRLRGLHRGDSYLPRRA